MVRGLVAARCQSWGLVEVYWSDVSLRQGCASLLSTTHPSYIHDPTVPFPGYQSCRHRHDGHSHAMVHHSVDPCFGRQVPWVQGTVPVRCRPWAHRQQSDNDGARPGGAEAGLFGSEESWSFLVPAPSPFWVASPLLKQRDVGAGVPTSSWPAWRPLSLVELSLGVDVVQRAGYGSDRPSDASRLGFN